MLSRPLSLAGLEVITEGSWEKTADVEVAKI